MAVWSALAATAAGGAAWGALCSVSPPPGNPTTPAKVRLGKALFWEEQISSTRTVACGTCHIPSAGGNDPRSLVSPLAVNPGLDGTFGGADDILGSPGVPLADGSGLYLWTSHFGLTEQSTNRRTVSSLNAHCSPTLFWDGRAGGEFRDPITDAVVLASGAALESQAVGPPVSDVEMGHQARLWQDVLDRIGAIEPLAVAESAPNELLEWIDGRAYADLFEEAFGSPGITAPRVAMAIAAYERTQVSDQAPFDLLPFDPEALTELEQEGLSVFSSLQCNTCHQGFLTTDNSFRYTGVRPTSEDPGRFAVTGNSDDLGKVRTPNLRNLTLRAPYMHNGRFATIDEVIDFYLRGGDFDAPSKDPLMAVIGTFTLTPGERTALLAFLGRPLTDPRLASELPPFDRPTLYTESDRVPVIGNGGVEGSGAFVPQPVALEPPLLGNPGFTIGVYEGLGGATAWLVIDDVDPGSTLPAGGSHAFESVVLGGVGAGAGFGSVSLALPSDPGQAGSEWFGRWYVEDSGGGGSHAVSPLFQFRLAPSLGSRVVFIDGFESGNANDWSAVTP